MVLIDSKRIFIFPFLLLVIGLASIIFYQEYQKYRDKNIITIFTRAGLVKIKAEYAETQEKREKGLMGKESLPENSGMILVFSDEKNRSFWMKDVLIPLDLIFIASNGRINEIVTLEPCLNQVSTCPIYYSQNPARFVVEVNAGFARKSNIIDGDILEISGF